MTCITLKCPSCLGKKGSRHSLIKDLKPWHDCGKCHGTGHLSVALAALTPEQLQALRHEISTLTTPPDPATEYDESANRAHLTAMLSSRWIESIALPEGPATHIDLLDKRGHGLRIAPEIRGGRFHSFNTYAIPPS